MRLIKLLLVIIISSIQIDLSAQDSLYSQLSNEIVSSYKTLSQKNQIIYFEYYRHKYLEDTTQQKIFLDPQFGLVKILSDEFGKTFTFNDLRYYQTIFIEGRFEDHGIMKIEIHCIIQTPKKLLIYENSSVNNYRWNKLSSRDTRHSIAHKDLLTLITSIAQRENVDPIGTMEFLVSFINKEGISCYPIWLTDKDLLQLYTISNINY